MNNLLSYCGLVDATITASEKDLHQVFISQKFKKLKEEESLPFSLTDSADSLGISILSSVELFLSLVQDQFQNQKKWLTYNNPKANESSKAGKPLDQVYDSLDEKNMWWQEDVKKYVGIVVNMWTLKLVRKSTSKQT